MHICINAYTHIHIHLCDFLSLEFHKIEDETLHIAHAKCSGRLQTTTNFTKHEMVPQLYISRLEVIPSGKRVMR